MSSRSAAHRWAESRERLVFAQLMNPAHRPSRKRCPHPGVRPAVRRRHSRVNRQKPSGIASKERILRVHLLPALGHRKLDTIKSEDVQRLNDALQTRAPKTVNNVLAV
jgi:hypothetical protein